MAEEWKLAFIEATRQIDIPSRNKSKYANKLVSTKLTFKVMFVPSSAKITISMLIVLNCFQVISLNVLFDLLTVA